MPSLVDIGPVVLEKKMKMWKVTDRQMDGQKITGDQKTSLELSAQVSLKKTPQTQSYKKKINHQKYQ